MNGVRYSVGYAVRESYLLSSSGISKQILYYRILTAVLCGALVLIGGGFAVASFIRDRRIRHLNSELTAKTSLLRSRQLRYIMLPKTATLFQAVLRDFTMIPLSILSCISFPIRMFKMLVSLL